MTTLVDAFDLVPAETASVELSHADHQARDERAGTLSRCFVHGPNNTLIPTFYNTAENAFVPVFTGGSL